jgi:hypothetical protein
LLNRCTGPCRGVGWRRPNKVPPRGRGTAGGVAPGGVVSRCGAQATCAPRRLPTLRCLDPRRTGGVGGQQERRARRSGNSRGATCVAALGAPPRAGRAAHAARPRSPCRDPRPVGVQAMIHRAWALAQTLDSPNRPGWGPSRVAHVGIDAAGLRPRLREPERQDEHRDDHQHARRHGDRDSHKLEEHSAVFAASPHYPCPPVLDDGGCACKRKGPGGV